MFDAYEAVDNLIDEINEEYEESACDVYEQVYEELCERVDCGELTLEEAEIINDMAAEKYLTESTDLQKAKKGAKKVKTITRKLKLAYMKASSVSDYQNVVENANELIAEIDNLIETIRSTPETEADVLEYIGKSTVRPALILLGIDVGITGLANLALKKTGSSEQVGLDVGTLAKNVGKDTALYGGTRTLMTGIQKYKYGKAGDNASFKTFKAEILAGLRQMKQKVIKIKRKAESKISA